jgi:hypothetical protein
MPATTKTNPPIVAPTFIPFMIFSFFMTISSLP